jgi:hypothetical protein
MPRPIGLQVEVISVGTESSSDQVTSCIRMFSIPVAMYKSVLQPDHPGLPPYLTSPPSIYPRLPPRLVTHDQSAHHVHCAYGKSVEVGWNERRIEDGTYRQSYQRA